MNPQRCIAPAHEGGDCWRACIASILNLPAATVPHFAELSGNCWDGMYQLAREWLAERGVGIFRTYCSADWTLETLLEHFSKANVGVPIIVNGQSGRRTEENHAVIAMNGRIAHDPSGVGVIGPCINIDGDSGWWWIDVIAFADASTLQSATLERRP